MPTLLEHFDVEAPQPIHGRSIRRIFDDPVWSPRTSALYGWFGKTVNVTDGRYTYFRGPARQDNQPLNHYFLMPTSFHGRMNRPKFQDAQLGRFLPYTSWPVIRARHDVPITDNDKLFQTMLYDIQADYHQRENLVGRPHELATLALLTEAMRQADAPSEQYERLGLVRR